jgi:hypothetical protein
MSLIGGWWRRRARTQRTRCLDPHQEGAQPRSQRDGEVSCRTVADGALLRLGLTFIPSFASRHALSPASHPPASDGARSRGTSSAILAVLESSVGLQISPKGSGALRPIVTGGDVVIHSVSPRPRRGSSRTRREIARRACLDEREQERFVTSLNSLDSSTHSIRARSVPSFGGRRPVFRLTGLGDRHRDVVRTLELLPTRTVSVRIIDLGGARSSGRTTIRTSHVIRSVHVDERVLMSGEVSEEGNGDSPKAERPPPRSERRSRA